MTSINSFTPNTEYFFLSNFYPLVYPIKWEGGIFYTVENAYQASKIIDRNEDHLNWIKFQSISPSQAKKLGRYIRCRTDWNDVKVSIMKKLLILKFSDNTLKQKLLATEDVELIEGNWWG